MALAGRGLGRRPGERGGVSVAVDGRGGVVDRHLVGAGPGDQIRHAITPRLSTRPSMVRDARAGPRNGSITDAGRGIRAAVRASRPLGRLRSSPGTASPSSESSSTFDASPVTTASMTSATSREHVLQRGQEGGDLVVGDLRRRVAQSSAPPMLHRVDDGGGVVVAMRSRTPPSRPAMLCSTSAQASAVDWPSSPGWSELLRGGAAQPDPVGEPVHAVSPKRRRRRWSGGDRRDRAACAVH